MPLEKKTLLSQKLMIGLCSWGSVLSIRLSLIFSSRHEGMSDNPSAAGMSFPFCPAFWFNSLKPQALSIPTRCKKGKEVQSCPKARNALLGAMSFHAVRVRFHFCLRLDARRNRKEFRSFGSEILVRSSTFFTPPLKGRFFIIDHSFCNSHF